MSSDHVWGPPVVESAPSPWDERVRFLAAQLRALARTCPVLALEARQLAHSIEELAGLEGLVSEDYVATLFSRARGLASVVQQLPLSSCAPGAAPQTVRSPAATVPLFDGEDEEPTKPGTPSALGRFRHSPQPSVVTAPTVRSDESPGSGFRPVLRPHGDVARRDTSLRLRTG